MCELCISSRARRPHSFVDEVNLGRAVKTYHTSRLFPTDGGISRRAAISVTNYNLKLIWMFATTSSSTVMRSKDN